MKLNFKAAVASAAALAIAGTGLVATAGGAAAYTGIPPWNPDANAKGTLTFYDASGNAITGGSSLTHIADFFAVSTPGRTGATKANGLFAAPDPTKADSLLWATGVAAASANFPVAVPASVAAITNPVATVGTGGNLNNFLATAVLSSAPGYQNVIQVRVKDSGIGVTVGPTLFWSADIEYNPATATAPFDGLAPGSWKVINPVPASIPTTTTLSVAPASGADTNTSNIVLTATLSTNSGGTVVFKRGTTVVDTQTVAGAGPVSSAAFGPLAAGTYGFTVDFTPAAPPAFQVGYGASQGVVSGYVVTQVVNGTTTQLVLDSASIAQPNLVTGKATVTNGATSAPVTTGTVQFKVDGTNVGSPVSYDAAKTGFPFSVPSTGLSILPADNPHLILGVFTPASSALGASTSAAGSFTITASANPSDTQYIQTQINPGVITITTPYSGVGGVCPTDPVTGLATSPGTCNYLVLPAMTLDGTTTGYTTSATFKNISVLDTRPGNRPYTVSALSSSLTRFGGPSLVAGTVSTIDSHNVGLTGLVKSATPAVNNVVPALGSGAFFNQPAALWVAPGTTAFGANPTGLGNGVIGPKILDVVNGRGTTTVEGLLTINAPTNTIDGTYTGTVTFTVIGS